MTEAASNWLSNKRIAKKHQTTHKNVVSFRGIYNPFINFPRRLELCIIKPVQRGDTVPLPPSLPNWPPTYLKQHKLIKEVQNYA